MNSPKLLSARMDWFPDDMPSVTVPLPDCSYTCDTITTRGLAERLRVERRHDGDVRTSNERLNDIAQHQDRIAANEYADNPE